MPEMTAIGSEISLKDEDDRVFGARLPAASKGDGARRLDLPRVWRLGGADRHKPGTTQ
jgi:hypothetical protein